MSRPNGLHQRRPLRCNDNNDVSLESHTKHCDKESQSLIEGPPKRVHPLSLLRSSVAALCHIASIATILLGLYHRAQLHNGSDCEMTYSQRRFVLVPTLSRHPLYQLYQFQDERLLNSNNIRSTYSNLTNVLYIPGHWGSYTQCRSLGAHGVQLTRNTNYNFRSRENGAPLPLFNTYAIDWKDQGSGWHGSLLMAQREYLQTILAELNVSVIVGHSLGGLVAARTHSSSDIITLATPHKGIPYTFEKSIHTFYQQPTSNNRLLLSISGGWKDEMIPPALCEVESTPITGTVQASVIMTTQMRNKDGLGMDHKAIVWCHNLLSVVTRTITQLTQEKTNGMPLQDRLRNLNLIPANQSYFSTVTQQKKNYSQQHGNWKLFIVESAMIYHAEVFLGLLAMNSGFRQGLHHNDGSKRPFVPIIAAILAFGCINHDISFGAILVLSFASSTVLSMTLSLLRWLKNKRMVVVVLASFPTLAILGYRISFFRVPSSMVCEAGLTLSYIVWMASILSRCTCLDALIIISLPCLVIGKGVAYYYWFVQHQELQGLPEDMIQFVGIVIIPIGIRQLICTIRNNDSTFYGIMGIVAFGVIVVAFAMLGELLHVGGGFHVGYLTSALALVDIFVSIRGGITK